MTSRLASLLVQENLVPPKTMADAFQRQVIYGGTLDTILLEMKAVTEPQIVAALAKANALPPADAPPQLDALSAAGVLAWFDAAAAERLRVVPLYADGGVVRVMSIDALDRRVLATFGHEHGKIIEPFVAPEHRYMAALGVVYGLAVSARFQSLTARVTKRSGAAPVPDAPAVTAPVAKTQTFVAPIATAAPVATTIADVPAPRGPAVMTETPVAPLRDEPTQRAAPREAAAPDRVTREIAQSHDRDQVTGEPGEPLAIDAALKAIDAAVDRDRIFAAVCRGARSIADVVVLFTVQADTMTGRLALADSWVGSDALSSAVLSLEQNTPFRTATLGHAPLLAKVGEDSASRTLLTAIGRRPPLGAALVPIVLRARTVALLYADASGKRLPPSALADLSALSSAAARAFQRLILAAKGRDYRVADAGSTAKVVAADEPRGAVVAVGGWRAATPAEGGPGAAIEDAPTARHVPSDGADLEVLLASVARSDDHARSAAEQLLALGARGVEALVSRLPGPLRIERATLRGPTPPLEEHGPLLSLLARFGAAAAPHLEPRLDDQHPDVRYYATLALGELGQDAHTARIGQRLFDRDAQVRKVAAEMLRRRSISADRTAIIECLRGELPGPERDRQRHAADALGVIGDAESVPRLVELVKNEDETLRNIAHRALVAITRQDFGTSRWRWRGWWDRHRNEPRAEWLFEGLAHASDEIRAASALELFALLPETFGYAWDAPRRDRDEARRKWHDAYRNRRR